MLFKKISGVQIVSLREQNRLAGTIIGSITGLFVGYYIAGYDFRGLTCPNSLYHVQSESLKIVYLHNCPWSWWSVAQSTMRSDFVILSTPVFYKNFSL